MTRIAKHKFGLAGTSCAGKTTLAYGLVSRLKSYGALADGVFNQDRRFSFPRELIESEEIAQNWMITNLVSKEIDISLHGDVDILVSDRTVIDFFAYYLYQYPDSALCKAMWVYVKEWAKTYDKIYVLQPLPFQEDGKRPSDDFRNAVHETLVNDIVPHIPNAVLVTDRNGILTSILKTTGVKKPNVKDALSREDVQAFSDMLNRVIVRKIAPKKDHLSDDDLYILHAVDEVRDPDDVALRIDYIKTLAQSQFGPFVNLDICLCFSTVTFEPERFEVIWPSLQTEEEA